MNKKTDIEGTELRVLVLEDSTRDLEIMREQLSNAGYRLDLTHVENEADFTASLRENSFDLILADFKLPGFDGFGALHISRQLCPETPFICVSGNIGEEIAVELLKTGAVDCVFKHKPERFPYAVKRALEEAKVKADYQKAVEALRESEERFRVAQEMSPDGFTILHPIRNEKGEVADFTFIYENQTIARINKTDPKKVIGKRLLELFPNHRGTSVFETYLHVANTGKPKILEEVYVGEVISRPTWLRLVVVPMGEDIAILSQDITERKQAETDAKKREIILNKVFDMLPIGLWLADKNGKLLRGNPAGVKIWGAEPKVPIEEYGVFKAWRLPSGEEIKPHEWALARTIQEKATIADELLEIEAFDGKKKIILNYTAPVLDDNGEMLGAIVVNNDITEKKQAEEALQETAKRLQIVSDNMLDLVSLTDLEGCYKFVGASHEILGYEVESLIGRHVMDFVHPDDFPEVQAAYVDFISNKNPIAEASYRYRCADGTYVWLETFGTVILDDKGKPKEILFNSRDITERKQVELKQQLQYNIARATITTRNLNELFEFIKKELNSIIDAKNFVIAFYNEASGMLSANVDKDEKDEIPEWPAEKSITGYVIRQNRPLLLKKNEILRLHKEGIIELYGTIPETWLGVPLKVEGKILGAVVVQNYDNADTYDQTSIEIMELVSHELSLFIDWQGAEGKATKLSRAVEQSSVSVMITNREGVIEYVNPFFTKLTGYSLEEVMGENPNILQSGHQSNAFYQKLWDTILSGNDWEGEVLNKKKNGDLYWEQAVISPIVNSEGVVTNFVAIKEDITERKKMLEDLVAAKEKAEESDRLKSAFLANVSHEIRTPMNGIMGFADILKRPNLSDAEREKYISIIEKSGVRLLHIINDIIDISKIETGMMKAHIRESNVNEQVEYIYNFFKHEVKAKGIEFTIADSLPANEAIIYTDREKVFAILTNLVKNAIKYTKEGSIELGVVKKGDFLEFYVKDTGIGIPESRQEAIFERFIQADIDDKMALQGTGLGLSISKAYVEMLGGNIWVESKEGTGSTFYFTLPYNTPLPIATILSAFPMV